MLARTLGATFGELCDRMTADEFALWRAEYAREPWGDIRGDLRAGIVASTIANFAGRTLDKNAQRPTAADYMPRFGDAAAGNQEVQEMSPAEWVRGLKGA